MRDDDDTAEVQDTGGSGAEGGGSGSAGSLPPVPDGDDDTPLGDTDQHSEVPPPPMKR